MRKFLAFFLIALVACTAVEEDILQGWWDKVIELYNKLKAMGIIDMIVNALRTYGVPYAKQLCCNKLPDWCSFCEAVLNLL